MKSVAARRRASLPAIVALALQLALMATPATAPAQETITALSPLSANTADKPQSKVWFHAGHWWTVLPGSGGTWLWRLEADHHWANLLRLSTSTSVRADARALGDLTHILLWNSGSTQLVSVEYVPASDSYALWSFRPTATSINLSGSETATIDIDTTGHLWLSTESGSEVRVYTSAFPYTSFTGPIVLANNIAADDITCVMALPSLNPPRIGVFWSNQNTKFFGFRTHLDGDANTSNWSADERPASQSQLNVGAGMADDHMNAAVASDGTLFMSVKTSYNNANFPLVSLLVRRPGGTWDNLYQVDTGGTRGIVVLNEPADLLRVVFTTDSGGGNIVYRDSKISTIGFSARKTLITGNLNNATSTKDNWTDSLVVLASGRGVLFTRPPSGPTTTTTSTTTTSTIATTSTTSTSTSTTSTSTSTTSTSTSSSTTTTSLPGQTTTTSTSTTTTPTITTTSTTLTGGGVNTYQAGVSGPAGSANVDTNIRLDTSSTNLGTDPNVYVGVTNGPTKDFRAIMAFNLADIPSGATITGCTLKVNVTQRTNPTPGHVRELCSEHWLDGDAKSETQATWLSWKTGTPWTMAGAGSAGVCGSGVDYTTSNEIAYTPPAGTGAFTFPDLTPLCQNAIAQGGWLRLRINQDAETTQSHLFKFDSSDATTATNRPKLSVTWH
jgi:hypothetical protein